ncbi:PapG chaperone-binding domain-containing protein [Pluralibacter sp.]|uniref:PapG chaperone-binding domain-containing protein n=1 Tax=Pluralibacter sp. TaxID=1920032 RepID=UPI0025F7D9F3|nr:PapG chaperone-binding domain-containing protein [Pluralibacter sp.]MBV8043993.1 hypothetical protein [Pluralibacter sp.]
MPILTSMRNLFKYLGPITLAVFFSSSAHSANTYSYLWKTTTSATGSLNYSGNAFGIISGQIDQLNTGTMSVAYVSCSRPSDGWVNFGSSDSWVFISTSINVGGKSVPLTVSTPVGYVNAGTMNGYTILVRRGGINAGQTWGGCSTVGRTYPINYIYPNIDITIAASDIPVGLSAGTIPIRFAFAEYFGVNASDITKFNDSLAFNYATLDDIPYNINILNKCSLISSSDITIAHGQQSIALANNSVQSAMVTVNCDQPASVSLSLTAMTPPTNKYTDGVGVGLGHGWDSSLTVSNSGISDTSSSGIVNIPSGSSNLMVTSTLKTTNVAAAGLLQGSAVLTATIQ